jgi:hypothetical protein
MFNTINSKETTKSNLWTFYKIELNPVHKPKLITYLLSILRLETSVETLKYSEIQ